MPLQKNLQSGEIGQANKQFLTPRRVSWPNIPKGEPSMNDEWWFYLQDWPVQVGTRRLHQHPRKDDVSFNVTPTSNYHFLLTITIKPDPRFVWTPKFFVPNVKMH